MRKEKKHNYVYIIHYSNNMKYIGVRSCNCEIVEDKYIGSSKVIPEDIRKTGIKKILKTFNTRSEAVEYERKLQIENNVKFSDNFYNIVVQTSTKFDQSGLTAETHSHLKRMQEKLTGRTKENCEYIRKANEKRKLLRGDNQTDAQKAGRISMREKLTGVKNPAKGRPGAKATSFVPWYYIDNNGIRTEIHNISKKDFAKSLGIGYRVFIYRFSKENEHKPMLTCKKGKLYKWTFGNLETPTQTTSRRKTN